MAIKIQGYCYLFEVLVPTVMVLTNECESSDAMAEFPEKSNVLKFIEKENYEFFNFKWI